ncbi:DsrE family protein [Thermocrinis albus DSM 14484]|uniref:DsrE family protein n=1 Tax=Thermocrinis albus (strain DSM 14484 / JCM 11386 / HI 11/12) TaxID=638303 RepID=D3SNL4_THEAH|nr:DsrE family protein [Thermocrinis albus]ADC88751.1 DsrE family protein [Thermocrinis albus DSM 14484]
MRVAFILKGDPFSWKSHEAIRIALAMGINHQVDLILLKDGVYTFTRWRPHDLGIEGLEKLLENMDYVAVRLIVEDTSAEERGLKETDFVKKVEFMSVEDIKGLLQRAEAVLVW